MSYQTGRAKSLDDITLEDCLKYPIWEWALDEEGILGQDETWQRPIIGSDVTEEINTPTITFSVKGTQLHGSGSYDHTEGTLTGNAIWVNEAWVILAKVTGIQIPAVFVALPSIRGISGIEFVCENLQSDTAIRNV
jgi:hypothetical protein